MKNIQFFLTAFLMSMAMIIWCNLSLSMAGESLEKIGLMMLQTIIVVKYASGCVLFMPSGASVKQILAGYILADLSFCFPIFWHQSLFPFLTGMLAVQAALSMIYGISYTRTASKRRTMAEHNTAIELNFQGVYNIY